MLENKYHISTAVLLRINLTAVILLLLMGCGQVIPATQEPSVSTPSSTAQPAITQQVSASPAGNSQLIESASQTPSLNSLENPIPLDNTPDFSGMTPPPSAADPFVHMARQDLASRLKINMDQITFLKASEITWPDISQGCAPNSGQPLSKGRTTTGYRIWLEANGKEYAYHIGLDGQIVNCQN